MNKKLSQFAFPVLLFAFVGAAQAAPQDVTFTQNGSDFFRTDSWEVHYADASKYANSGYESIANALSANWIATNRFDASPAFFYTSSALDFSGPLFDLNSLWLAGAWGSQTLTLAGFDSSGTQVYTTQLAVTTAAREYHLNWGEISAFSITTGTDFVKDPLVSYSGLNWALGSANVTAVPEPEAYAMILAGLGLVGAIARRRRRI